MPNFSFLYGYDAVGNRTSRSWNGGVTTYTYDNNDKLLSGTDGSSFGYDASGNMTSAYWSSGSYSMAYDDENRLASLTYPTGTETFLYNALGQRMRSVLNGTPTRYVYNGDRVLVETSDAGSVLAWYTTESPSYYEGWLRMWRSGGVTRYPALDASGTTRRLVNEGGVKTDYYTTTAFGQELSPTITTPNPYRFDGQWGYYTDPSGSVLIQLGHRFYFPALGRFLQQDPTGDGINWYAYAADNPLVWVDPEGEFAQVAVIYFVPGVGEVALGVTAVVGAAYVATHPHETKQWISGVAGRIQAAASAVAGTIGGAMSHAKRKPPCEHPDAPKWRARGMPPPPPDAERIPRSPDYRVRRTKERWHPEPKHPRPKGPHWRITDDTTGRWLRDQF